MGLRILKPGLLTHVQDSGRWGYQKEGMLVSGAMDDSALRLANLLVGNPEGAAALELSLLGPHILFEEDYLIALSGFPFSASIEGRAVVPNRPLWVKRGSLLKIGAARAGCRAYLAVSGSFDLPLLLGSRATYLRGGLGGFQGRALQAGDLLPCCGPSERAAALIEQLKEKGGRKSFVQASWGLAEAASFPLASSPGDAPLLLRAMRGPEWDLFRTESQQAIWESPFLLSPQSDRMGLRLQGTMLALKEAGELLSSAVTMGTVQVPAGGQPIVLGADRQTTGGYPRIAQVISADFSILAQARPGSRLQFQEVSLAQAQQLALQQHRQLGQLALAIALKLKHPA
jgi:antagonist of KipI